MPSKVPMHSDAALLASCSHDCAACSPVAFRADRNIWRHRVLLRDAINNGKQCLCGFHIVRRSGIAAI